MILSIALISVGPAFCQENAENNNERHGKRRGGRMQNMRKKGKDWFMNLSGVKEEMEKHQANMKEIMGVMRKKGEEMRGRHKDAKDNEDARDKAAEAVKEAVADVAEKMVTERIRHTRAIADLLEDNKDEAISKLKEEMEKRHQENKSRRGGGRKGGRNQQQGGENDIDIEGAVF
ncbi:MAG: hypothetical protein ACYTFY_00490 [Planctomycetota bacterium]|jgi:hypothetical protein